MCTVSFLDLLHQHRNVRKRSKAYNNWKRWNETFFNVIYTESNLTELSENLAVLLCAENCCTQREQQSV